MIEVRIPKEITEYKEKIIFGMSLRQLVFFTLTIVLSIGTYYILTKKLGLSMDSASYVIIFESIPLMAIGFIRINGFPFEKYLVLVIRHKLGIQKRKYKTSLLIDKIESEEEKETKKGGKEKYAWIFEKGEKRGRNKDIKEANIFTITKKDRKRKRKKTLQQIKGARKEYRKIKQRENKKAKKTSTT